MTTLPRIKICCISSIQEAQLAIRYGADALGLVGPMPSGPGVISNEQIAAIAKSVPPPIATFLLTSETSVKAIVQHHQQVGTNTIQLVDRLQEGTYQELRAALPQVKIVQAIHILNEDSVRDAILIAKEVDALLLDSGNPKLATKELGGTGRVHNWDLSRQIRAVAKVPVFLAGGINAANLQSATRIVRPFGLDLCTGVRTKDALDTQKLASFFKSYLNLISG